MNIITKYYPIPKKRMNKIFNLNAKKEDKIKLNQKGVS